VTNDKASLPDEREPVPESWEAVTDEREAMLCHPSPFLQNGYFMLVAQSRLRIVRPPLLFNHSEIPRSFNR
jgi:hypothetical protein